MNTWLITGGAGFIGANFVRLALERADARLVILDKLTYAGSRLNLEGLLDDPRLSLVVGDIADRRTVDDVFREHRPMAVLNFAAESHVDRSIDGPGPFIQTNIVGAFELLDASKRLVDELPVAERSRFRFLHVSTDEVYGSLGDEGLFRETTPYAPNSPYAASKASADHLVRAYQVTFDLPTLITNCSNNYGPYQFPEKLIPVTILNAVEGRPLPIYGDGLYIRDWIHVEDHCAGILQVLQEGRPGEKYNIGGHCEKANLEIVDRICDVLETIVPAAENPAMRARGAVSYLALKTHVEDRRGHDRRYAIDAGKIGKELGWRPKRDFDSSIVETVRWYLDRRDWCAERQREARYDRERLGLGR